MDLVFNVIFAWVSVILAIMLSVIWILRVLIKGKRISPQSKLGHLNRQLRIYHKWIGIAFIVSALIHGIYSSMDVLSFNFGTYCFIIGVLLGMMYLFKKRLDRKKWVAMHRILTVMLFLLLAIHIIDIGGAPATKALLSGSGNKNEYEALGETTLLSIADEAQFSLDDGKHDIVYKDGSYIGSATGYGEDLTVDVMIESGIISDVNIVSHNEIGPRFYEQAMEQIPKQIIESQSVNVDSISGSTFTSVGIKNAVIDALNQAVIEGEMPIEETLPESNKQRRNRGARTT